MAGIDDHVKVEVAFGIAPLNTAALAIAGNWDDITSDCRLVDVMPSQRTSEFEGFVAGRCKIVVDNQTRLYDPLNTAGAHYGDFERFTPIRVTALKTSDVVVWQGYMRDVVPTYRRHPDATSTIVGGDLLWLMSELHVDEIAPAFAGDTVSVRIIRLLVDAGLTTYGVLDSDSTTLQATTYGDTLLALCTAAAQSNGGLLFHNPATNKVTFHERNAIALKSSYTTPVLTLDDTTEPKFMRGSVVLSGIASNYRNVVSVTGASGIPQIVDKTAANEATRSFAKTLDMESDGSALALAKFWADLYSTSTPYVQSVKARPFYTGGALRETVLDVGLRDRITVSFDPPGGGSAISVDVFIDKIRHVITPSDWVTTFGCTSADVYDNNLAGTPASWFVIGDATKGKVGTGQLGY